jgi:hypothetical protein
VCETSPLTTWLEGGGYQRDQPTENLVFVIFPSTKNVRLQPLS